jgi:protein-S-isoprenylcysteine O-methyltransferase Ste14
MPLGKPFRYLFFAILQWQEGQRAWYPASIAIAIIALLGSLNVFVIVQVLQLCGICNSLFVVRDLAKLFVMGCYILIASITWLLFVRSGTYNNFAVEFADATKRQQLWR